MLWNFMFSSSDIAHNSWEILELNLWWHGREKQKIKLFLFMESFYFSRELFLRKIFVYFTSKLTPEE